MPILKHLSKHIPEAALHYSVSLKEKYHFLLKVTKKRVTKAGDYRYDPRKRTHTVTVNNNLNAYAFLITYIHEVAHCAVMHQYGRGVKPHGIEWKNQFRELMLPLLSPEVFPDDVLRALSSYLRNPKASSYADTWLTQSLRKHNLDEDDSNTALKDLQTGQVFQFNKRIFEKELTRRTRVLCKEVKSGRRYLIPAIALVNPLEG